MKKKLIIFLKYWNIQSVQPALTHLFFPADKSHSLRRHAIYIHYSNTQGLNQKFSNNAN